MSPTRPIRPTVIFLGAMWSQRNLWDKATRVLPTKTCLLVFDENNSKVAKIMRQVARSYQNNGRPVHTWMTPINRAVRPQNCKNTLGD